jgi:lipid II:glycine glycyltransferase (peptidoglycan interpeptide bridge formation enzyme)
VRITPVRVLVKGVRLVCIKETSDEKGCILQRVQESKPPCSSQSSDAVENILLNSHFVVETDQFGKAEWEDTLSHFEDASLYQSWSYSAARWGEENLSHLAVMQDGEIVGAAQVTLVRIPILKAGLAYVKWGPMWQRRGKPQDPRILRQILKALWQVYAVERKLLVRVSPWEYGDSSIGQIFNDEGFGLMSTPSQTQTAVIDLSYSIEELKASLKRHWRHNLKLAEKNALEIEEGSTDDLANEFLGVYEEMRARKSGGWIPPIGYFSQVQRDMPDGMKPWIGICRKNGEPVAGLVVTALGLKGLALFAATGDKGLDSRGSYLLWWRAIERLKERGVQSLDMGGVNEETHRGTTQFKMGLCGRLGRKVQYLGDFNAIGSVLSHLVVGGGDTVRMTLIKARENFREWRRA